MGKLPSGLGFVVYPDRRRLKRRKGVQFRRRLRALLAEESLESAAASLTSWLNHVRYGNTVGLQKAILSAVLDNPQVITRQGTLAEFFATSPLRDSGLEIERPQDGPRAIEEDMP